jgi:hypothetical protein
MVLGSRIHEARAGVAPNMVLGNLDVATLFMTTD